MCLILFIFLVSIFNLNHNIMLRFKIILASILECICIYPWMLWCPQNGNSPAISNEVNGEKGTSEETESKQQTNKQQ